MTMPGKRNAVLASSKSFHFSWRYMNDSANKLFMSAGCSWFVAHDASMFCRCIASAGARNSISNHRA